MRDEDVRQLDRFPYDRIRLHKEEEDAGKMVYLPCWNSRDNRLPSAMPSAKPVPESENSQNDG